MNITTINVSTHQGPHIKGLYRELQSPISHLKINCQTHKSNLDIIYLPITYFFIVLPILTSCKLGKQAEYIHTH